MSLALFTLRHLRMLYALPELARLAHSFNTDHGHKSYGIAGSNTRNIHSKEETESK